MPPLESHHWWATVNLQNLPSKRGHHSLECLMAGCEVRVLGAIVFVGRDNRIVGADPEHVFGRLWRTAVNRKSVVGTVDCTPIADVAFEACFYLPVLDEIFDEAGKTCCFMAFCFGW